MLTEKMGGIFDCRAYDQSGKLSHDQRRMLTETDNITFSALIPIDRVPGVFMINGQLDEFAKPKPSRSERDKAKDENREPVCDMVNVKFKIGRNAKWFDEHAKPCSKPTNEELEASRWQVQIDFNRKPKDPSQPLKPAGYWCNAIMISKVEENPFAGKAFSAEEAQEAVDEYVQHFDNDEATTAPAPTTAPAVPTQAAMPFPEENDDGLPF